MRRLCITACAVALGLLALPAAASAYMVTTTADTHDASLDDGYCEDSLGQCSLRAALEQTEYSGSFAFIVFGPSFDGGPEDSIYIESPLEVPNYTQIDGGDCDPQAGTRPCVWIGYRQRSTQSAMTLGYQTQVRSLALGNAGTGIYSEGTSPWIRANWIGLGLDGTPTPVDVGISLVSGYGTTVGGGAEEGNRIAARQIGVNLTSPGSFGSLTVSSNWIGLDPATNRVTVRPSAAGVVVLGGGTIDSNKIAVSAGTAVLVEGYAQVDRNWIGVAPDGTPVGGGAIGVRHMGDPFGSSFQMRGNVIGNVAGPGVLAHNGVALLSNFIGEDPAGRPQPNAGPGVRISAGKYGSSSAIGTFRRDEHLPNVISNSGGPAIDVRAEEFSETTIGRNTGTGNSGPFIDLGGDGPGNPQGLNDGTTPPRITGASPTVIKGFAQQRATINVFFSASGSPGDFTAFLGEVTAGWAGPWKLVLPSPLPPGSSVAATQYSRRAPRGTSEASLRPVDAKAPSSSIKIIKARGRVLTFRLNASERDVSFRCALDSAGFKPCPRVLKRKLSKGQHQLQAVATDSSGNVERTASRIRFRVS